MSNELTTYGNEDGWDDAAHDATAQIIRGKLMKFADWRWTAGQEATLIPDKTRMAAYGTAAAWVRWENGKPAEYRLRAPGGVLEDRDALGFTDEATWEKMPDGKTRDPWQNTRFVYFVDPTTAEEYTWSTSSMSGIAAVSGLGGPIQRMRTARPGAVPVVELGAQEMKTKYGRKSKPHLKIVEWVGGSKPEPTLKQIDHKASPDMERAIGEERKQQQRPAASPRDFNDEIPW